MIPNKIKENEIIIHKLHEDVINRIAAGEVIHRPCNALKELVENSIDAGSTNISIIVNQGGLKLLQITDDGHGIRKKDLPIACERFTTSKLRNITDLMNIQSFGFRGEALASISHVAHVTIISRTKDQECAYKAQYRDGKLIQSSNNTENESLKPCAGKVGTQIIVEDLFYNMKTRKEALKNSTEQYQKILDVVQKYSIHYAPTLISFTCKKYRESFSDLHARNDANQMERIKMIYGNNLGKELLPINIENADINGDDKNKFSIHGYVSNACYSMKKANFLLFINNRLVECNSLKKACENIYSFYLPKNTHPFLYLSVTINPENIDVNVHPTKKQVHFLFQEEIIEIITEKLDALLRGGNESRSFTVQPVLTQLPLPFLSSKQTISNDDRSEKICITPAKQRPTIHPRNLVRTDPTNSSIRRFQFLDCQQSFTGSDKRRKRKTDKNIGDTANRSNDRKANDIVCDSDSESNKENEEEIIILSQENPILLSSIKDLMKEINNKRCTLLEELLRDHTFVGVINKRLSLIQHKTKLYLVKHIPLIKSLLYQKIIYKFGNLPMYNLKQNVSLEKLILMGLSNIDIDIQSNFNTKFTKDPIHKAKEITNFLFSKKELLNDYFSIQINDQYELISLPEIITGHAPLMEYLPEFLLKLFKNVDWETEKACFHSISIVLSDYYSILETNKTLLNNDIQENKEKIHSNELTKDAILTLEHIFYRSLRNVNDTTTTNNNNINLKENDRFIPLKEFHNYSIFIEIACLKNLYKIFERC